MMGERSGFTKLLIDNIPSVFIMGCICHSMALCASHAVNVLPSYLETFLKDVSSYFSRSSKRKRNFMAIQQVIRVVPHLLLLSASPYSGSPQRKSIFHFSPSTSSPSLAPTLPMSFLAKSIHLLLGLSLSFPPGTAVVYNINFDPDFAAGAEEVLRRATSFPNVTSERGDT